MIRHRMAGFGRLGSAWRVAMTTTAMLGMAITAGTGLRADEPPKASTTASVVQQNSGPQCAIQGTGTVVVLNADWCVTAGASALGYGFKEMTDTDVSLVGQRIPTPFATGAGVPIALYFLEDVNSKTRNPGVGGSAEAHMLAQRTIEDNVFRAFVRITADSRTRYDDEGNAYIGGFRQIDQSYFLGALDEAWVQINGFKFGVQQSLFGFNRLPSVVTPGYTSIVTTPAISYTHGLSNNASISFSLEDGGRRLFGDGVLARPERADIPDAVALLRFRTPSTLYHLSGAIHQSEDQVMKDFAGGPERRVSGWALSAGLQSRVQWDDFLGEEAKGVYGRFGLTVAYASGALGYLGTPLFAPDYVVSGAGGIDRSSGWSGIASYEHMLAPSLKFNSNLSYFNVRMHSRPEAVIPDFDPNLPALPELDFSVRVQGLVAQIGLDYIPGPNWVVGFETGYTWTEAQGTYAGVDGGKVSASYPHIGMYARRMF